MMSDLVGDHVGVRKLPRCAELSRHDIEETQVEVNDVILRAVERPGGGLALTACGRISIAKQTKLGIMVGRAALLKFCGPDGFGTAQHLRHELRLRIVGRRAFCGLISRNLRGGRRRTIAAHQPENHQRIYVENPTGDERNRDAPEAYSVDGPETAGAANVLDILTFALIVHSHSYAPRRGLGQGGAKVRWKM